MYNADMKILLVVVFVVSLIFYLCFPSSSRLEWQEWNTNYDGSVGCKEYHLIPADAGMSVDVNGVMSLTANTGNVPGLFMNAIAGKHWEWKENSRYIFSGYFRKPFDAQSEHIDVNLQFVQDFTEHHVEIFWTTSPFSPLSGWVWTRYKLDEQIKLFYLGIDENWHSFEIVADYSSSPRSRKVYSLKVDDRVFVLNHEMGTNPKDWEGSFMTLLETHNTYTNCNPLLTFVGKSEWKNIKVEQIPLPSHLTPKENP